MTAAVKEEPTSTVIDVPEYIDRQPVGAFQIRLLLICAAVLFIDGFDTQAIGYVAPAVGRNGSCRAERSDPCSAPGCSV